MKLHQFVKFRAYYLTYTLHERLYYPGADRLITVSEDDARFYRRFLPGQKVVNLPNFLDEELYDHGPVEKENYIVMTANFYAYQNELV